MIPNSGIAFAVSCRAINLDGSDNTSITPTVQWLLGGSAQTISSSRINSTSHWYLSISSAYMGASAGLITFTGTGLQHRQFQIWANGPVKNATAGLRVYFMMVDASTQQPETSATVPTCSWSLAGASAVSKTPTQVGSTSTWYIDLTQAQINGSDGVLYVTRTASAPLDIPITFVEGSQGIEKIDRSYEMIKAGDTSRTIYINFEDTAGNPYTGLTYNTTLFSCYYTRTRGAATVVNLATLAAANSAWASGGFKEVDATNAPGVYRFDIPDAVIAAGATSVILNFKGVAPLKPLKLTIPLVAYDPQDSVDLGLTAIDATNTRVALALPNAAFDSVGGLSSFDTLETVAASTATILDRIGNFVGTGVNTILGFLRAMVSKTATLPSDLSDGVTYNNATDSNEAIRDRGDAAWTGGGGGGGGSALVNDFEIGEGVSYTKNISDAAIAFGVDTERRTLTVYRGTVGLAPTLADVTSAENVQQFQKGRYTIGIHSSAYVFALADNTHFAISDNIA